MVQFIDFGISSRLVSESCNRVVLAKLREEEEEQQMTGAGRRISMPDIGGNKEKRERKAHNPRGTLAYMAPEQTGRMNRVVDYRSDFYSLGITFYEILVGSPPFVANDPLEYIHQHLAKIPPRVEEVAAPAVEHSPGRPRDGSQPDLLSDDMVDNMPVQGAPTANITRKVAIPYALGSIVAKLLAKTAEERYQSAQGLSADLKKCLDELTFDDKGNIVSLSVVGLMLIRVISFLGNYIPPSDGRKDMEDFVVGQKDCHSQFLIPQKLYGREWEVAQLMAAYDRGANGKKEAIFVRGYSGIGKSSIINEVHKPIAKSGGYFICGKFDQFRRNTSFLMVAFR